MAGKGLCQTAPDAGRRPTDRSVRFRVQEPMPMRTSPRGGHSLDQILDAGEAVVLRDGMGRLTLESVARQAGLSKAGLLHHVPSKDTLIRAMVERHCAQWLDQFKAKHREMRARGCGAPAIATFMETCMSGTHSWTDADRARNRVMVAALVHDEKQVEPLRRVMREIDELIASDRLAPGVGDAINLAVHGLWFQWIFGTGDVSEMRLARVREALEAWAKPPHGSGSTRTKKAHKPARAPGTPPSATSSQVAKLTSVARMSNTRGVKVAKRRGGS